MSEQRTILDVIADFKSGDLLAELTEEFRTLVMAVENVQKGGKLTLTIAISPPNLKTGAMAVDLHFKSNQPQFERDKQLFFPGEDGLLQLNHPRQTDITDFTNVTKIKEEQA